MSSESHRTDPPPEPPEPSPEADLGLVRRVVAGDRAAAESLARRLYPVALRVARSLATAKDAEDAAQAALVHVLRVAGTYRGRGPLEGWGYRVVWRHVLRTVRRAKARETAARAGGPILMVLTGGEAVTGGGLREGLPRPLEEYLGALKPVQCEALVLRHGMGHTLSEIATMTDAPVPTVKSRIVKAMNEIRRAIRRDLVVRGRKGEGES